jgi:hypothetical protein
VADARARAKKAREKRRLRLRGLITEAAQAGDVDLALQRAWDLYRAERRGCPAGDGSDRNARNLVTHLIEQSGLIPGGEQ